MEEDCDIPKTIKQAVELYIGDLDDEDFELLTQSPKSYMKFLYSNLERKVIKRCSLSRENIELLEDCGSEDMPIEEAAHIIIKKLWEYCQ